MTKIPDECCSVKKSLCTCLDILCLWPQYNNTHSWEIILVICPEYHDVIGNHHGNSWRESTMLDSDLGDVKHITTLKLQSFVEIACNCFCSCLMQIFIATIEQLKWRFIHGMHTACNMACTRHAIWH